jgi:ribonuclease D
MSVTCIEVEKDALPIRLLEGDLDKRAFGRALETDVLAWDIETTGLDWRTERIGTVQIQVDDVTYVVRANGRTPSRLKALMEDEAILKILHHAMFDLRFLAHHWDITSAKVACTKIASKLVDPDVPCQNHSLAPLVDRYLGVKLDKGPQRSDWVGELSSAQLQYAANDVRYLGGLYEALDAQLRHKGLRELRDRCYAHLRTQVELEVGGFPDVFAY